MATDLWGMVCGETFFTLTLRTHAVAAEVAGELGSRDGFGGVQKTQVGRIALLRAVALANNQLLA